jgi:hypothetical protein
LCVMNIGIDSDLVKRRHVFFVIIECLLLTTIDLVVELLNDKPACNVPHYSIIIH